MGATGRSQRHAHTLLRACPGTGGGGGGGGGADAAVGGGAQAARGQGPPFQQRCAEVRRWEAQHVFVGSGIHLGASSEA